MSDESNKTVFGETVTQKEVLLTQGAVLMGRGAAIGGAVFFGALIFVWLLTLVSSWLPPESKEMPDPNILQRGALEAPVAPRVA